MIKYNNNDDNYFFVFNLLFDTYKYVCLQQTNGWPLQLLSVACLSLAAKMEETLVPSLLDLQVYIFLYGPILN